MIYDPFKIDDIDKEIAKGMCTWIVMINKNIQYPRDVLLYLMTGLFTASFAYAIT